jgi:hypothetical protein
MSKKNWQERSIVTKAGGCPLCWARIEDSHCFRYYKKLKKNIGMEAGLNSRRNVL